MDNATIDLMVASGGGRQMLGNIWQMPSMRRLMYGTAQAAMQNKPMSAALDLLRPNFGLHPNATLQKDEWIAFDEAVVQSYLPELVGVADLLNRGLTFNLGNPFGTMHVEWQDVGEMTEAQVAMRAGTPPELDRLEYETRGVPVPIISKGFQLDERALMASRMRGDGLDTTQAMAATRVVSEKLEELLFAGSFSYGAYTLYGYTTHPNRNTGSLSGDWSTYPTITAQDIVDDVIAMITTARGDHVRGPFVLYIPDAWDPVLDNDYVIGDPAAGLAAGQRTIRERILALAGIEAIRPTVELTASVVLVALRREVVDVPFGFEPRLVQWEDQGGMVNNFRVISIMSFRLKRDHAGRSGIVHYS